MLRFGKSVAALAVSVSLIGSSTAAVASTSVPAPASNSWLTLSMLTTNGGAVVNGTAVAAAQPESPPPPPPPGYSAGPGVPPIPVLAVLLAVIAVDIYIATRGNHHHRLNSPI